MKSKYLLIAMITALFVLQACNKNQDVEIKSKKPLTTSSEPAYFLQVAAFPSLSDAEDMKTLLSQRNFNASVDSADIPGRGILHRVRIGPLNYPDEVNSVKNNLDSIGIKTDLIKVNNKSNIQVNNQPENTDTIQNNIALNCGSDDLNAIAASAGLKEGMYRDEQLQSLVEDICKNDSARIQDMVDYGIFESEPIYKLAKALNIQISPLKPRSQQGTNYEKYLVFLDNYMTRNESLGFADYCSTNPQSKLTSILEKAINGDANAVNKIRQYAQFSVDEAAKYAEQGKIDKVAERQEGLSAESGEVGNLVFVAKPKAPPVIVSKSGSQYWPCNGFVNKKLINIIYEEIKILSESSGVPSPSKELCLYNIGNIDLGFGPITTYQVHMYINQSSMDRCLNEDYCDNFRTMTFRLINEKLHRQYMITNAAQKLTKMSCISMNGQVVSANSGCS